jgi:hypothetical protein
MHQYWPKQMDHIDGNPSNNAISNLREATPAQNVCNTRVRRDSSTGIKGVWQHDSKFIVVIQANNERKYYGIFNTFEEARLMAAQTRREVHGAFAREA